MTKDPTQSEENPIQANAPSQQIVQTKDLAETALYLLWNCGWTPMDSEVRIEAGSAWLASGTSAHAGHGSAFAGSPVRRA